MKANLLIALFGSLCMIECNEERSYMEPQEVFVKVINKTGQAIFIDGGEYEQASLKFHAEGGEVKAGEFLRISYGEMLYPWKSFSFAYNVDYVYINVISTLTDWEEWQNTHDDNLVKYRHPISLRDSTNVELCFEYTGQSN